MTIFSIGWGVLPKHFPSLFCAQGLDVDSALLQDVWQYILGAFTNHNLFGTNKSTFLTSL